MRWKLILSIVVAIAVALIVTVFAVLSTYDFNKFKSVITKAAKDATGRELKIAGDIDLKIGFTPALVMEGVSLENATWGSRPQMARVKLLEVQVVLLPLIRGILEVKRLIVIEPDILIETNNIGKSNLELETVDKTGIATPEEDIRDKGINLPALTFKDVRIEEGRITYRLGQSGKTYIVILNSLTASADGLYSPVELDLSGKYNEKSFGIAGTSGSLVDVIDSSRDCHLDLTARIGAAAIKINGTVRDIMNVRGLALDITAEVPSIKDVAGLVGAKGVPDVGSINMTAKVLSDPEAGTCNISDIKATLGDSDLGGSVVIKMSGKRPHLNAILSSQKLDLRPLLSKNAGEGGGAGRSYKKERRKDRVFPNDPLTMDVLKHADANIKIQAGQILMPQLALNDLVTEMVIEEGHLKVEPFKTGIGGGKLEGRIDLRPHGKAVELAATLKIEGFDLGRMLKELEFKDTIEGKVNAEIDLYGSGGSVSALTAGINGKMIVIMGKGRIDNKYIDLLGADLSAGIIRLFNPFKDKTGYTEVNCFVSRFDIKNGLADITVLVFDTINMVVVGHGKINLKTEGLDLALYPSPKKGIGTNSTGRLSLSLGELTRSFKLVGTLANPSLSIDTRQMAITLGKGVGGVLLLGPVGIASVLAGSSSGDEDLCLVAMEAAEKGVKVSSDIKKQDGMLKKATDGIGDALKNLLGN